MLMVRALGMGGTERQAAEIAKFLDRGKFAPHVACFHEGFRAAELRQAGVPILCLPVRSFLSPGAVAAGWRLGRYMRRERIRLVHTFDYPLNCFGVPVARAFRIPVVLSSQRADRALNPPGFRRLLRLTDRMVDGIVVNPGAWTHYAWAIHDALELLDIPVVEVHLSNVDEREEWRKMSVLSDVAAARFVGHGPDGYRMALDYLKENAP